MTAAHVPDRLPWRPAVTPGSRLTARERQVLDLVSHGLTDTKIGKRLYLTNNTVKSHVRAILIRLDAVNRSHAVRRGFELGVLRGAVGPTWRVPVAPSGPVRVQAGRVATPITPPAPGRTVLACRCGTALDAAQMRRRTHAPQTGQSIRIDRITCTRCADPTVPHGIPTTPQEDRP